MAGSDTSRVVARALRYAAERLRHQRRPNESPLINHSIEKLYLLAGPGRVTDVMTLVVAILHDVLACTTVHPSEIDRFFGPDVRALVEEITVPRDMPAAIARQWQLDRLKHASPQGRLVGLADKIATVRGLSPALAWTERQAHLAWIAEIRAVLDGTHEGLLTHLDDVLVRARAARGPLASGSAGGGDEVPSDRSGPTETAGHEVSAAYLTILRQIRSKVSRAEFELDDMIASIEGSVRPADRGRDSATRHTDPRPGAGARRRKWSEPYHTERARPGVGSLDQTRLGSKKLVSVDHRIGWLLSTTLAHLLDIIAFGGAKGDDGFPRFQTLEDVAKALAARTGRETTTRAVTMGIHRLRAELERHGLPALLVETSVKYGVRFRLRQSGSAEGA